ncbi:MAG: Ig-like domain-containing protein, partial [Chloroflexi bacterium]|nr:Ig-like domain-containing protein [Chloroflexota bacterium]
MKKKLLWLIPVLIVITLVLSITQHQAAIQPVATPLSISVQQGQVGPQVIRQNPIPGQRLGLTQFIQIVFDRDMDQEKTNASFSLLGPDRQSVAGQIVWPNTRTFEFTPNAKLKPATVYKAVFTTQAAATDGSVPQEQIELQFKTIDQLTVAQVFPTVDAENVDSATNITVIFNRPVVPVAIREEQSGLPQPLEFTPALEGHGEWVSSSVYVYQPDQALLSGTRYTVRVDPALKDTNGDSLEKSFVWQFQTSAPYIQNYALQNGPYNPGDNIENVLLDQPFIITFSQAMDQKSVAQALTLTNRETGQSFPTQVTWDKTSSILTIKPSGKFQIASFYQLNIADSARAQDGGNLREGLSIRFSTVPLPAIVKVTPEPNSVAADFDSSMTIQFASPMKFASMKGKVQITPAPKTEPQYYYNDYDYSLHIWGLEPGTDYVVRVLPGASDLYGNTIKSEYSFSFKTGDMQPYANLVMPWTPLVYRAQGPQEVYFEYTNVDFATVSLYSLTFDEFSMLLNTGESIANFKPQTGPINEWAPNTQVARNQLNRLHIQLKDPKGNALPPGYYLLGVKGRPLDYRTNFYQTALFIVATDNITFKATPTEGLAWITDLESGQPQANVKVTFYDDHLKQVGSTTTDQNGVVYLDQMKSAIYVRAEGTNHTAFTALNWGSGVWTGDFGIYEKYYGPSTGSFAYVYTDRPVYRPGQDVYFKGIVRQNDDLHYSLPAETKVYVTIEHDGENVFENYLPVSELGSFNNSFKLADDAGLGTYNISVRENTAPDSLSLGYVSFRVAEYHKPEFQVNAAPKSSNVLLGDKLDFSVDATYYSGGNVGNGTVNWFMQSAPYYFAPKPKYSQYNFMDWDRDIYWSPNNPNYSSTLAEGQGVTDANGHFDLSQSVDFGKNKASQQVTFNANVTDVAGNVVSGQASVIVHQSQFYAGIRSTQYIGKQGEEQPFQIVVLDWDSNPVANQTVTVKFMERRWYSAQEQDKQGQLRWVTSVKEIPVAQKTIMTGADGTAQVSFVPPAGGVYKATVTVTDSKGHSQFASAYIWVTSEKFVPWRQTNDRSFNLIADKDSYAPGDTAEILIAQPFQNDVYALITYERGHIYKHEVVLLKGNSTVYKLPITADMAPNMYVSVTVINGAEGTETPDFKIGMTHINIDTSQQTLDVKITADKKSAGPGDKVTYTITTKDANGKPVSADVSLAVVDKAALALAPSNSAPILTSFYSAQSLNVQTALGLVSSADDFNAQYRQSIPEGGGSGGGGGGDLGIITVRQDFKDTAAFRGQVTTDASGMAQVTVQLPENLTTWVADARAATTDSKVGQATQELVSTKPLFIELQTPRFFTSGDEARLGA